MFLNLPKMGVKKRNRRLMAVLILVVVLLLVSVQSVKAGWFSELADTALFSVVSSILYIPVFFFSKLITISLIPLMIWVASYNNFISQTGVSIGWVVVRDLANMFVVAGILLVAVGTLLNIETYSYKKLLPKLIMGAVVINFSKMIIGLMIDVSQVITLTFVKAFQDIAAGNLLNSLGIQQMFTLGLSSGTITATTADTSVLTLIGSLLLATLALVVLAAVLIVLIAYFVGRMIILWMAIILSPLLFVLPFVPSGDKFASQVWGMVSKQLFSGPLLAFFLWLSFKIMTVANQSTDAIMQGTTPIPQAEKFSVFISTFGNVNSLMNYIVVIGLLFTSLMLASQMGAAGGKLAGDLAGKLQGAGKWLATKPFVGAGKSLDRGSLSLQKRLGIAENKRISLRPSIMKEAWKRRTERKEERYYGAVTAGMTDRFASGSDKGKAYRSYRAEQERKRREEIRNTPGADNAAMHIEQIRSMMRTDASGHVVGIRDQGDAPAVAASLLELARQRELSTAHASLFGEGLNNNNFEQLFRRLINNDTRYADDIGYRAQRVAQESGDVQYTRYGATIDSNTGRAQVVLVDNATDRINASAAMVQESGGRAGIRTAGPNRYAEVDSRGQVTSNFNEAGVRLFVTDASQYISNPGEARSSTRNWAVGQRSNLERQLQQALTNNDINNNEFNLAREALEELAHFDRTGITRRQAIAMGQQTVGGQTPGQQTVGGQTP